MKKILAILALSLTYSAQSFAQTAAVTINTTTGKIVNAVPSPLVIHLASGQTLTIDSGATITNNGTATGFGSGYTLPAATTGALGGVIVPASGGLTVDGSGNVSINAGTGLGVSGNQIKLNTSLSGLTITGSSLNGVTPSASGSTTLFLNQAGGYTTPAGTTYTAGTGLTLTTGAFNVNAAQNITSLTNLTSPGLIYTTGNAGTLNSGWTITPASAATAQNIAITAGAATGTSNNGGILQLQGGQPGAGGSSGYTLIGPNGTGLVIGSPAPSIIFSGSGFTGSGPFILTSGVASVGSTTGSGSYVLGTSPSISGATITTSTVNGVTPSTSAGSGNLLTGAGTYASVSTLLDAYGTAQGSVLYRGASTWTTLGPGTSGQVLASGGASANPFWTNQTGGGGSTTIISSDSSLSVVNGTNVTINVGHTNTWTVGQNFNSEIAQGTNALGYTDTGLAQQWVNTIAGYQQTINQNLSAANNASADYIVGNNLTTASTHYGDFGINSSTFSGSGALNGTNNIYLTGSGGDLAIGTTTANPIHVVYNGAATDTATFTSTASFPYLNTAGVMTNSAAGAVGTVPLNQSGGIQGVATSTYTPTGASPTINFDTSIASLYTISMTNNALSGTPTIAWTNTSPGQSFAVRIIQNSTNNIGLNFPSGTTQAGSGTNFYTPSGTNTTDVIGVGVWTSTASTGGTNVLWR